MSTLYVAYNVNDDNFYSFGQASWNGQTFTPHATHLCSSIRVKLAKNSGHLVGTVTISIRAIDINGLPTGGDLVSGTLDGNKLTESDGGEWVSVGFSSSILLAAETPYAIVVRAPSAQAIISLYWRHDSNGGYTEGNLVQSFDSGLTWAINEINDHVFEEWGDPLSVHVAIGGKVRAGVNVFRNS